MLYQHLIKPVVFRMSPENAHQFTMRNMKKILDHKLTKYFFYARYPLMQHNHPVHSMGLRFKNKMGLAAGFDKDGKYIKELTQLGFGFVEIGTVTPRPQQGNPKPRLFRLPKDQALINRMGFNNEGVHAMQQRLEKFEQTQDVRIGANIGKNKDTPNQNAHKDYTYCIQKLNHLVDYFTINISSPNTQGLRDLQKKDALMRLLDAIQEEMQKQTIQRPMLIKMAPDLTDVEIDDMVQLCIQMQFAGIIATNTTTERNILKSDPFIIDQIGNGGLSGAPLFSRAFDVVQRVRKNLPPNKTLIGVGGIHEWSQAASYLDQGAQLIQVYTGMIYEGPQLLLNILRGMHQREV